MKNGLTILLVGTFLMMSCSQKPALNEIKLNCPNLLSGCTHTPFTVSFNQTPSVLKPFKVRAHFPQANQVAADVVMQGMAMGLNRYQFKSVGQDVFEATIVLPVCVQGRSDWVMHLEVKRDDEIFRYQLPFNSQ